MGSWKATHSDMTEAPARSVSSSSAMRRSCMRPDERRNGSFRGSRIARSVMRSMSSMRESARLEEVVRAGGEPIAVQPGHDVAFAERPEELLAQGTVPADRRRREAGEELLKVGRHLDPQGRRARRPRELDDGVASLWLGSEH